MKLRNYQIIIAATMYIVSKSQLTITHTYGTVFNQLDVVNEYLEKSAFLEERGEQRKRMTNKTVEDSIEFALSKVLLKELYEIFFKN